MDPTLDFYLQQLANPLTEFIGTIPRGKALRERMKEKSWKLPNDSVRQLPVEQRLRLNALISKNHTPLGRDIEVAEMILDMLEVSLSQKRPSPRSVAERENRARDFAKRVLDGSSPSAEAIGRCLFGLPGLGKTRTLRKVLEFIPPVTVNDVVKHPLLLPKTVNYAWAETPSSRQLAALVSNIIIGLGNAVGEDFTKLAKRGTKSDRLQTLAMLVMELNLGVLIIDELQHVLRKKLEPDLELTNFIVELSNCLGVPLLLVGTPQAKYAIGGALRIARRALGPEWDQLERKSDGWKDFSKALIGYQLVRNVAKYENLEPTLFDLSQGLPGIAVNVFQFAQKNALLIESETGKPTAITKAVIRAAFERYMWPVAPMIDALRSGDTAKLALFMDLYVDEKRMETYLQARHAAEHNRDQKEFMRMRMAAHGDGKK